MSKTLLALALSLLAASAQATPAMPACLPGQTAIPIYANGPDGPILVGWRCVGTPDPQWRP
ncbi:hypothetical protein [Luteimonas aquatica]|uniref:hypothetical protein n=1 Tax=Luteimonas aquatica TaxID=450364 RepID=UPI001F5A3615|nr:hypothetical protein [Luteimonas aquatica]